MHYVFFLSVFSIASKKCSKFGNDSVEKLPVSILSTAPLLELLLKRDVKKF